MKLKYLFIALLFSGFSTVQAQDFHNSFFQFAPAVVSPSLTGAFYGNLRVNAIVRDEGRTVTNGDGFLDLSLMLDYNIDFGFTEGDWVSIGGAFSRSSNAGVGAFRRQFAGVLGAYHLAFGKRHDKVFSVGVKYGSYQQGPTNQDITAYQDPFGLAIGEVSGDLAQWLSSTALSQPDAEFKTTSDYAIGLSLDAPLGKSADIRIGIAGDHIFEPRLSVPSPDSTGMNPNPVPNPQTRVENLNRRINAYVFLYTDINNRLGFNPNIILQRQGVSTNVVAQALFSYAYKPEQQINFLFGFGARFVNDFDIPLYLAYDTKDLRVGLSYDVNIGPLRPSSSTVGAFELAVTKLFNWHKKPEVEPKFICPRL